MVVIAALGTTLGIAARPYTHIHSIDRRPVRAANGERMVDEQLAQSLRVDPSSVQRGVEATPSAPMRRLEARVNRGRAGAVSGEESIGEFKESVGSAMDAFVERATEVV
jgi:hypothetical protein